MKQSSSSHLPKWEAENTHLNLTRILLEKLREVKDPEIGMDIIQLGLIRDVSIKEDSALVQMILTTPFCPYAPAMLEMTRKKAEEALERPTTVKMGTEAWKPSMMEEGFDDWGLF